MKINRIKYPILLVEDHHEVLAYWRTYGLKDLPLIHIDAHMDFWFYSIRPVLDVIKEARTIEELKGALERTLLFRRFQRDLNIQTNIGNYIYPAMREGIAGDFYWVIPGTRKEFGESRTRLREIIKDLDSQDPHRAPADRPGKGPDAASRVRTSKKSIETCLMGRRFIVTTLEDLPIFKRPVLLDIDTDFLVIDNLKNADHTTMIGKRQPWISPSELAEVLKNKIRNPAIITIAYSVNGGFTPIKYRHLGDEVAYRFSPLRFKKRYARLFKAARHFGLFTSSGRKEDYQKAAALNPAYRSFDNTYGPLYLASRRFSKAESEFRKIIRVDPENPFPRVGLGCIALERGDYHRAKRFFSYAARKKSLPQAVCGLAQAEFRLSYHKKAKRLFLRYLKSERLQPQSYYFLGRIYEKEKDFKKAIVYYKSAVGLGLNHIGLLKRIIHIARSTKTADDNLINYSVKRYKELKKSFYGEKDILRKDKRNLNHMKRIEDRIRAFDDFIAPYMRCRQ